MIHLISQRLPSPGNPETEEHARSLSRGLQTVEPAVAAGLIRYGLSETVSRKRGTHRRPTGIGQIGLEQQLISGVGPTKK